jgi:SpoVK/Ycf46/Vps4 family AAA+-type ATPase
MMENDLIKNFAEATVNYVKEKSKRLESTYKCTYVSNSISKELKDEISRKIEIYNKTKPNLITIKDSIENLSAELVKLKAGTFSKLFQGSKIEELENEITSSNLILTKIKKTLHDNQIELQSSSIDTHSSLFKAYQNFINIKYNWNLTDNSRYEISDNSDKINIISNDSILSFRLNFGILNSKEIYIYNDYTIISQDENLSFYHNSDILIKYSESNYVEQEYNDDNNSKIVKQTWEHTNNDGSRNQRIKDNPGIPIRLYSNILIQFPQDNFHIVSTNTKLAFDLSSQINDLLSYNKSTKSILFSYNSITEMEFSHYTTVIIKLIEFSNQLKSDKEFYLFLSNEHNTNNVNDAIQGNILFDLVNSAKKVSNVLDSESKEYFILCLFLISVIQEETYEFEMLHILYSENTLKSIKNQISAILEVINKRDSKDTGLRFSQFLNSFNETRAKLYSEIFYDYLKLVCQSDNKISDFEKTILSEIVSPKESKDKTNNKEFKENIESVKNEINDLIGLQGVKNEIQSLINLIKIQDARKGQGLKTNSLNYHLVFTGNPGTGKTTVARIVSKIYKELGILKKGHLIETDRSGLIAEYVGQTAVKVNKLVDSALDGVLFIDEAYSITDNEGNDFGKEAISTLLKRMEDDRERLVVIVAGYSIKMNDFLESNPGLSSRFNRYIDFEDYSQEDLYNIFQKFAESNQYELTESAKKTLKIFFKKALENKDENFGNGRFVRNTFEKTIEKQSNRIAKLKELNEDVLKKIEQEDIP